MRKVIFSTTILFIFIFIHACKKSNDSSSAARTVQSISGSYTLAAITWSSGGVSANVYDSLPACEKDNIIRLNSDLTAQIIDTGMVCDPNVNEEGTWSLSAKGDSLYLDGNALFIKSWDGSTLVYTGIQQTGPPLVIGTTTLVKK